MSTGYILVDTPNHAQPQGTFPRRGGAKLSGTIIVHTSEGNWRSGVNGLTNLVRTRADYGCYHVACDWVDIARYYPWEWETWQDTETNNWAVGIAAACKTSDWGNMPADVEEGYYRNLARMAADFVTYMDTEHGITVPLRRITGAEARARKPGFAAHGDSGVARSDPGANFDWPRFFTYTAQALGGLASHGGTTITPLEDTLSAAEVKQITDAIAEVKTIAANTHAGVWNGGTNKGRKFNYGILPIVAESQRRQSVDAAQIKALVGALAAVAKGESFDEAKLLAGVQAAAEAGVKAGLEDGTVTVDVNVNGGGK